jgi:hypothetical protein
MRALRRLALASLLALGVAGALSVSSAWANPDPPAEPPAAEETPAPPAADDGPAPAPPAPAGEPFIPPGQQTPDAPVVPDAPVAPDAPSSGGGVPADGTQTPTEPEPTTVSSPSDGSSPSPASRAGGAGIVVAGAGAAAAGGWFGRRPDETKDEHTRRLLGGAAWGGAGTMILVAKGITLASGLAGIACFAVAGVILWWGAPSRVRSQPAPAGPPVDLQTHINAAQDHNLQLNQSGVRTQSQGTANPVDEEFTSP